MADENGAPAAGELTRPGRVREVIANPDPVVRNLQITQSYHELARALDTAYGGGAVPWCVFATWASKQAGEFIRGDEVPGVLRRFLGRGEGRSGPFWSPRRWLQSAPFLAYARLTVDDVSSHVASGNHLVYAKLAPLFAELLMLVRDRDEPDPQGFDAFLEALAGEPDTTEALPRAFRQLYSAHFEADAQVRAERLFLGNLLVGWHEQIRLQEAIEGSLGSPVRTALADPERSFFDLPMPLWLRRLGAAGVRRVLAPAIESFEDDWRRVATRCLMTLGTPGGTMDLSDDVPPLPDGSMYPPPLREVRLAETLEVLAELDRSPGTTLGSAARDWGLLGDRMNYVADYFRSRALDRALLAPPYAPSQVSVIYAGRVPGGTL